MKLGKIFGKVAIKRLSRVETHPGTSRQHEINGVKGLVDIFGKPSGKETFPARFLFADDSDSPGSGMPKIAVSGDGEFVTWYDSRLNQPERSPEYRLYYSSDFIQNHAEEGDLLVVGFDGTRAWLVIARRGSTVESQLLWMFTGRNAEFSGTRLVVEDVPEHPEILGGVEKLILESLGIEGSVADLPDPEELAAHFGGTFPTTREFSAYARSRTGIESSLDDPDRVLLEWWNMEEKLFYSLEKYILERKIEQGFENTEDFIAFALSVINRRKSRAGHAFENHIEQVFLDHGVSHTRGGRTEGKSKPDFIFPSEEAYRKAASLKVPPDTCIDILGAKTTCKDRWRQVTREADILETKHLLTLEPAISTDQTDEMKKLSLQLVVPKEIIPTYRDSQQSWLMDLAGFISMRLEKERKEECRSHA